MLIESVLIEIKNAILKELPETWKETEPEIVPMDSDSNEYEILFRNSECPVCACDGCDGEYKTVLDVCDSLIYAFVAADDEGKRKLGKFIAKELLDAEDEGLRENAEQSVEHVNENKKDLNGDSYEEGYNRGYDEGFEEGYDEANEQNDDYEQNDD